MNHVCALCRVCVAPRALRAFVTRIENNPIPPRAGRFSDRSEAGVRWIRSVKRDHVNGIRSTIGAFDSCGQATKGTWGMSWRQKPMKGVEDCDKPGVVVKRALIPGFPN
jgi:hypothetical protein